MSTVPSPVATAIADAFLTEPEGLAGTKALLVMRHGEVVLERYAEGVSADTTLVSWSMAKSFTQAVLGLAVEDGLLDPDQPAPIAAWQHEERSAITIRHLLTMRSGLRFREDYVDGANSDVIEMLWGAGKLDVAAYAVAQPLEHPPGEHWQYSSGTTNILCRIIGDAVGGGADGLRAYVQERLLRPLGMHRATMRFDAAGTFIGSSFLYATAREFATFGELYRLGGIWGGTRLLPEGWTEEARTPTPTPATEEYGYANHWWLWPYPGAFAAHGYEGQHCVVVPDRGLVVVRLATTPDEHKRWARALLHRLIEAFPVTG